MGHRRNGVRRGLGGAVGLVVLAAFVVPSSAAADPVPARAGAPVSTLAVGSERPIADAGPPVGQYGDSGTIAFGGDVYLSTWSTGSGGVWASRVSRTGEVLDQPALPISDGETGHGPAVSFDGANFLVVWSGDDGFRARRVSPAGALLGSPLEVTRGLTQGRPKVAFDGANHLIAWSAANPEGDTGGDIVGRRVSPQGAFVDPDRIVVAALPGHQGGIDLAGNGTNLLVVWQEGDHLTSDVFGMLVSQAASALGDPIILSDRSGPQSEAAVTSVGNSYFVAWTDGIMSGTGYPDTTQDIFGTTVDSTGAVLHPSGVPISETADDEQFPAVTSDGTNVLVTWQNRMTPYALAVRGARVGPSDTVLDPSGFAFADLGQQPAVAGDGVDYFAVATTASEGKWSGIRITGAGAVLDPTARPVAIAANSQTGTDMVFDGSRFMTVWSDNREGGGIYGARVGPAGEILDGPGFPVATGAQLRSPALAFDGTNYLVVWEEGTAKISGALMNGDGAVLSRFDVASTAVPERSLHTPAVAFGGGTFLVAWSEYQPADYPDALGELRAARVTTTGTVVDTPGVLLSSPGLMIGVASPTIAYGTSDFLVAWTEYQQEVFQERISGARVATTGVATAPFHLVDSSGAEESPDIAWGDGTYLLVWGDHRAGEQSSFTDIYGTRISAGGEVLDPGGFAISTSRNQEGTPSVAFNGSFLVAWQDRRRGGQFNIYAQRVEADGTVPTPGLFPVAQSPQAETDAVVTAAPGDGQFAVAYQRHAVEAPYGTHRAFFRNVSPK